MQKIELNKGDFLILKTDKVLEQEQVAVLKEQFETAIERAAKGETTVCIVDNGLDVVKIVCKRAS